MKAPGGLAILIAERMKKNGARAKSARGAGADEEVDIGDEADDGSEVADDEEQEMGDYDSVKKSAAKDAMAAIKANDVPSFTQALDDYVEACVAKHLEEQG